MGIVTGIIVFVLIWWVVIFAVLPFGHTRDVDGTPQAPNLKRKLLITSIVAVLIWAAIYVLIESDIVSFRELASSM